MFENKENHVSPIGHAVNRGRYAARGTGCINLLTHKGGLSYPQDSPTGCGARDARRGVPAPSHDTNASVAYVRQSPLTHPYLKTGNFENKGFSFKFRI